MAEKFTAEYERKTFHGEVKAVDEAQGIAEMYVSVFNNTDLGGDIVRAGAFDKAAARKLPKGVWAHDPTQPIAKTLQTEAHYAGDPRLPDKLKPWGAQYVKAQFNLETQAGRDAFSNIKGGYIDEFSFAYLPGDVNYLDDGRRELKTMEDWPEWSPVLQGMNPLTALISAKSVDGGDEGDTPVPFGDDLAAVVDAVKRVAERAKARQELRLKVGRRLSAATMSGMQDMRDMMGQLCDMMDQMMAEEQAEPDENMPMSGDMGKQWTEAMLKQIDSRLEQVALMRH